MEISIAFSGRSAFDPATGSFSREVRITRLDTNTTRTFTLAMVGHGNALAPTKREATLLEGEAVAWKGEVSTSGPPLRACLDAMGLGPRTRKLGDKRIGQLFEKPTWLAWD